MKIEITKRELLWEQYNSMVANNYILCYGRIINDENTRFRKFKMVVMIDEDDLYEYYYDDNKTEQENLDRVYTKQDKLDYASEIAINTACGMITKYDNQRQLDEFYDYCYQTISDYNFYASNGR